MAVTKSTKLASEIVRGDCIMFPSMGHGFVESVEERGIEITSRGRLTFVHVEYAEERDSKYGSGPWQASHKPSPDDFALDHKVTILHGMGGLS